jgi:hypothetical protein
VTWSNQQRSKIIREYGMRSLTRSLPLPVLTRSNNDLRHKNRERRRWTPPLSICVRSKTRYCSDTSSTLNIVGNVTSLVPRNWIRTVCPANELRLNGPLKTYAPAVPLF